MNWFYVNEARQHVEVNADQLKALAAAGTVKPDTLVWRDGMADWLPYQQVKAEVEGGSLASAESPGGSAPSASGTPPVDHAQQASADSLAAPRPEPTPENPYAVPQSNPAPEHQPSSYIPAQSNDGQAVASMICGIVGLVMIPMSCGCGLLYLIAVPSSIAAVVLGHLSLPRLRRAAGQIGGESQAKA